MEDKKNKRIGILYFSPTNTTAKICKAIASGMGEKHPAEINLTYPEAREKFISNPGTATKDIDHLIVGAPVYAGKLPQQVLDCLPLLTGAGKECTLIVVYGNRDYGIALRHMGNILFGKNFKIIAAGAFIGQHSYSRYIPIAVGRPDENDLQLAFSFGRLCKNSSNLLDLNKIPEQWDWISRSKSYFYPAKTKFIAQNCTQCGICAAFCPIGIISSVNGDFIDKQSIETCTGCMACVVHCKNDARVLKASILNKFILKTHLKTASQTRLEPLMIIP